MAINKPIPKRPRTVFSSGFWGSALWWKVSSSKFRLQNSKTEKKSWGSVPQNAIVCFCLCKPKAVNGWWGQLNYTVARDALCFLYFFQFTSFANCGTASKGEKERRGHYPRRDCSSFAKSSQVFEALIVGSYTSIVKP